SDIWASLKQWQNHSDVILSCLSRCLINRRLPVARILNESVSDEKLNELKSKVAKDLGVDEGSYFVHQSRVKVIPYDKYKSPVYIMNKDRSLQEISESSLQILSQHLLNPIEKFHLCYLEDRKSTRLNSSHVKISYAVFRLK